MAQYFKRGNKDELSSVTEYIKLEKGTATTVRVTKVQKGVLPYEHTDAKQFTDINSPANYPQIILASGETSTEQEFNKWNTFFN